MDKIIMIIQVIKIINIEKQRVLEFRRFITLRERQKDSNIKTTFLDLTKK